VTKKKDEMGAPSLSTPSFRSPSYAILAGAIGLRAGQDIGVHVERYRSWVHTLCFRWAGAAALFVHFDAAPKDSLEH
jgi:hypothetical protein